MFAADVIRLCLQEMGWSHTSAVKNLTGEFSLQMERWFQDRELEPPESPPSSYGSRCWLTWMLGLDAFSGHDPRVEVLGLPKTSGSETVNSPFPSVGNIGLKSPELLTSQGRQELTRLVQNGWTLLDRWPRSSADTVQSWLGRRLYLARRRYLNEGQHLDSIVSSQLGRHHQRMPNWPQLLNWAFRTLHRDHSLLLAVPNTTLYRPTIHFAKVGRISYLEICIANRPAGNAEEISHWLATQLRNVLNRTEETRLSEPLYISPAWSTDPPTIGGDSLPIRDRVAIGLADRVLVVSVRDQGNIAKLLERRLHDDRFSPGSVFVALENDASDHVRKLKRSQRESGCKPSTKLLSWLDQGAVGWIVLGQAIGGLRELTRCKWAVSPKPAAGDDAGVVQCSTVPISSHPEAGNCGTAVWQLCAPAEHLWKGASADWPYLVHCTRGVSGPLPHENQSAYFDRLWLTGTELPSHPMVTLIRILREQRLRGTTWMIRGNQPSVSLSAVPLKELLLRRCFQSHLGRWDWEPYGLMVHRDFLTRARQVVYGRQSDFEQLPVGDQVYFQPVDSKYDWSLECEWRVLGDLDLSSLPAKAITIFVRSRLEAVQLAQESRFPVIWTEGIHT